MYLYSSFPQTFSG